MNLPNDWICTRIGEVTEVVRGASPRPKGDPRYFGGDIPWIMISDISRTQGNYITKTRDTVTSEGAKKSRFLRAGTLILSNSGTVCLPKILGVDGCIHDGFVAFPDLTEDIDILFLYHYFNYIRPRVIRENRQGVTQVNLNIGIVKKIPLPLPPLAEQHRIVAAIEPLLARVRFCRERLDKVPGVLNAFRQVVLAEAFSGELTKGWRQENLPTGWTTVRIGDIVTLNYGKSLTKLKRQNGNVPVYGSNGIVGLHSQSLTSKPCLIIGRKGSVGAIHVSKVPCWAIDTTYYVEPPSEIDLLYLFYLLKTKNLASFDKSTAIPGLNRNDVYSLEIPIPPLNEQLRIVAKIEALFALADHIEERLAAGKERADRLTLAILAKAFSGELVPTEAELAKSEGRSYEPASVLLERIKEK